MKRSYVEKNILQEIQTKCDAALDFDESLEQPPLLFKHGDFFVFMKMIKDKYNFIMLSNIDAADYPEYFEITYNLISMENYKDITIKIHLKKDEPQVPSVVGIWPSANFQEREQFDLLGIIFVGHPDLKRILLPDDFTGYPLRKDFKQV